MPPDIKFLFLVMGLAVLPGMVLVALFAWKIIPLPFRGPYEPDF